MEKLKVENEVVFQYLLSLFIVSITGLLFCTTQKVITPIKSLLLSLYGFVSIANKRKNDVIVLAKGFIEDLGDAIMNLAFKMFLCIFKAYVRHL